MSTTINGRATPDPCFRLRLLCRVLLLTIALARCSAPAAAQAPPAAAAVAAVDYQRDIRPILSNHCFPCHGTDQESRQADLRLDQRDAAVAHGAILPVNAADSPLLQRVLSSDPEQHMPPAEFNKPLNQTQQDLLQRWIQQGAEYQDHWAFQPLQAPAIPAERSDSWCRGELDAFVLQRLKYAGLEPAPEADRPTLIRRLWQDLLGLLPPPQEVDQFVQDQSPDAWEKLVDRLLQSPHYGERWGRHWLDQARYADSNGYTIDGPRVMWPYRDWVISALNQDLPFDQFTIQQLAGDLLPEASLNQRIATGFHRNTMINEEGGVKPDQFRHEALIDRVNTTGAVWLGLTVGCAQCHTHKYDPITHEEYYRLYAFFNAAADANNQSTTVEVREQQVFGWTEQQQQQLQLLLALRKEKDRLEKAATAGPALQGLNWNWQLPPVAGVNASGSSILKILPDGSLFAKTHAAASDTFTIKLQLPAAAGSPVQVTALRLKAIPHPDLPEQGPGTASNGNFVLTEVLLRSGPDEHSFGMAWADHSQPKYPVEHAVDGDSGTGWAINVDAAQQAKGARMNAPHEAIFVLRKPVAAQDDIVSVVLKHDLNKNYLLGHFSLEISTVNAAAELPATDSAARLAQITKQIGELEATLPGKGAAVKQMVMQDQPVAPETFLLTRGEFLSPDRQRGALQPGVPAAVQGSGEQTEYRTRLDLARWLVSPQNPLTARVTVNRIWGRYFGRGLVETDNDFGFQGAAPVNLPLLDWLATEFIRLGWSQKQLHRLILTSAVYRQSSSLLDENAVRQDPDNYLLARQIRFRVEAEIVRDMALSASGLLSDRVGGPGVHLPQPDGIYDFTQNKKNWPTATGADRYRRTMYVMFYRSAPYPLLSTFDAPDFSTVCTRRVRSNTPLQSLTVANDLVFTELAAGLAARVLREQPEGTDGDRLRLMFRLCLTRSPQDSELSVLVDFLSRERSRFAGTPADAEKVKTGATSLADTGLSAVEQAAWTSAARVLLNTDEFVTRN
ncbi:MAG: PSD1 and planctomycete cytochrome C domain-containing protein [Planctomycetaceae bacterium]